MNLNLGLPTIAQLDPRSNAPPYLLKFRSSTSFILATICLSIFTDSFLYGFIVPVLPFSLTERSGVPEQDVQYWTSFLFAVFGGGVVIASPILGWYADNTSSRRWPMLIGLILLAVGTLLFGVGHNVWILVACRFLQGISAANVYTIGLALLVDTVGKNEVGEMMGYALSSAELGMIVSPLVGGVVYAKAGYNTLFVTALALISVDIFLRFIMIEKKVAASYDLKPNPHEEYHEYPPLDEEAGQTTSDTLKSDLPVSGNSPTSDRLLTRDSINDDPAVNAHDERQPLLPKSSPGSSTRLPTLLILLRSPRLLAATFGIFVQTGILAAFDTELPLFVKHTFGWNSLQAGVIFLSLALTAWAGPLVGKLSDRYGPRWVATGGFLAAVPFLISMRLVTYHSQEQIILLAVLLSLSGLFIIFTNSSLASDFAAVVESLESSNPGIFGEKGAYAQAFSLYNCSMAAGTLVFPIWAGAVMQSHGWMLMTSLLAAISALAAVPVLLFTEGPLWKVKRVG